MTIALATLASLCSPAGLEGGAAVGFHAAMALAGLGGSLLHCGPMCGGFVLAQAGGRLAALPAEALCTRARVAAGALPGYHTGRISTYAGLGALAGAAGLGAGTLAGAWIAPAMTAVAAGLFLAAAGGLVLRRNRSGGTEAERIGGAVGRWLAGLVRPLFERSVLGGIPIGLLLGFLPCGLVYAALAAAASTGKPLAGAVAMASFGLGTVPVLIGIGIAGSWIASRLGTGAWRRFGPIVLAIDGLLLLVLAGVGAGRAAGMI